MKRPGKCVEKKAYAHKSKAFKVAKRMFLKRGCNVVGVYECPTCLDFHITTKYCNIPTKLRKWAKEDVAKKDRQFTAIFNEYMARIGKPVGKYHAKNKRRREKVRERAQTIKTSKVKRKLENQISLEEQRLILNRLSFEYTQFWEMTKAILAKLDYPQLVWIIPKLRL